MKRLKLTRILMLIFVFVFVFTGSACSKSAKSEYKEIQVSIKTDKGEIVLSLRPDLMPVTVDNFVGLVEKNFYNGITFHRVEDWVIQGGDPTGTGRGGSDKKIKLETNKNLTNIRGAVAMARTMEKDSATSQFYILKKDQASLDGDYAVFGKVIKGMDVVDKISKGDKMTEVKVLEKIK